MAVVFAGDTSFAGIAIEMRRIDSERCAAIPSCVTGRLNIKIGFVRRRLVLRIGFARRIGLAGWLGRWDDGGRDGGRGSIVCDDRARRTGPAY